MLPACSDDTASAQDTTPASEPETAPEPEPEEEIVARIGDDAVVTRNEFERSLNAMGRGATGIQIPQEQRIELLNNIVDVKLQYVLATKDGVEVSDGEIDTDIQQKTGGMSPEQFAAQLAQVGITTEELRSLVREQITVARYRQNQTSNIEAVTDDDIVAEFDKLKESGQFDRVDVSHILITVPQGSDEAAWLEAKVRIDAARERVTTGDEEFNAVIADVSEDPGGGIYPDTPRGKMVPEFEERMFSLPVGGISEPFRTQFGWHILTPTAKKSMEIGELSERLRVFLTEQRINDFVMEQVAEAKTSMDIEIRLDAPTDTPAS
jgi:peptidyl-prolyl cis-trans isomerase SurA